MFLEVEQFFQSLCLCLVPMCYLADIVFVSAGWSYCCSSYRQVERYKAGHNQGEGISMFAVCVMMRINLWKFAPFICSFLSGLNTHCGYAVFHINVETDISVSCVQKWF